MISGEAAQDGLRGARPAHAVSDDALRAVPWALSLLLLAAFMVTPYLPMVDLPQHAAQIAVWLRLDDPTFSNAALFTVNLRTPYLTAYVAARVATWVGVVPALKLVVWASAVLHWFAFSRLVRRLEYPGWLGLLGLPLGLGYPFFFGMVSFTAAMPFVLLTITAALAHSKHSTWRHGFALAGCLCATVVAHGFAAGVAVLLVLPLLLRGGGALVARVAPLAAPATLWAIWLLPAGSIRTIGATMWEPRLLELLQAPALWFAASAADHIAVVLGYGALALVALALGRPHRGAERWAPLGFMVVGYCAFPSMLGGFGPLHPRFAAFFVPALLLAFEPRVAERSTRLPFFAGALCMCWLGVEALRLSAFTKETRAIRDIVARLPSGLRVRPIIFEHNSQSFPGLPALLHLSAYYLVEKGGLQGYSFAMYPTSVIRYAPSFVPGMGGGAEWHPETFSAEAEADKYDCFLVHRSTDPASLFGARLESLSLDLHEDAWWVYRTRLARVALGPADDTRRRR